MPTITIVTNDGILVKGGLDGVANVVDDFAYLLYHQGNVYVGMLINLFYLLLLYYLLFYLFISCSSIMIIVVLSVLVFL